MIHAWLVQQCILPNSPRVLPSPIQEIGISDYGDWCWDLKLRQSQYFALKWTTGSEMAAEIDNGVCDEQSISIVPVLQIFLQELLNPGNLSRHTTALTYLIRSFVDLSQKRRSKVMTCPYLDYISTCVWLILF